MFVVYTSAVFDRDQLKSFNMLIFDLKSEQQISDTVKSHRRSSRVELCV